MTGNLHHSPTPRADDASALCLKVHSEFVGLARLPIPIEVILLVGISLGSAIHGATALSDQ